MIAKHTEEHPDDWDKQLGFVAMTYNSVNHDSTGYTPFFLSRGREMQLPVDRMITVDPPYHLPHNSATSSSLWSVETMLWHSKRHRREKWELPRTGCTLKRGSRKRSTSDCPSWWWPWSNGWYRTHRTRRHQDANSNQMYRAADTQWETDPHPSQIWTVWIINCTTD